MNLESWEEEGFEKMCCGCWLGDERIVEAVVSGRRVERSEKRILAEIKC